MAATNRRRNEGEDIHWLIDRSNKSHQFFADRAYEDATASRPTQSCTIISFTIISCSLGFVGSRFETIVWAVGERCLNASR
jgi:hypothetical protein